MSWRARTIVQRRRALRASRPQLKRNPLGGGATRSQRAPIVPCNPPRDVAHPHRHHSDHQHRQTGSDRGWGPSRLASFVGAVIASSVAALVLGIVVFVVLPRGTIRDIEQKAVESGTQPTVKAPSWYTRVFPQAARSDSAAQQLVRSRGFVVVTVVLGAAMMALFIGVVAGAAGWSAAMLIVYAGRGAA